MNEMKCLIVDDERYSRQELVHLLSHFKSINVIDEADSGETAVIKALQLQPDVVFLDVEMPKMNGMEAAKALLELKKSPLIVFATAYPEFAAEAFRYEAIDYLLKPYDEEQLHQTVQRLEKLMQVSIKEEPPAKKGKLSVELEGEIHYLDPNDILFIFRDEKVSRIVVKNGEYEVKMALKELESRLSSFSFFRIHKGYLVNLQYVTRLTPWFNGAYQLELEGVEEKLSVSRNYVKALRTELEL
ncbi:LytR/AlgR family response regulator transcription factor [Guptibacillus hwajinpoensis]|uniref:LytR/AlgR family response regulator transcription factor n=1 Tax=Guptibacillus hwajinpoensis TaxID=208199 RepID=UPI001CFCF435|nr:LytTR family DNA-binding domain-containing protein [Pseudalkalibacillus hwajinpoensis]WLR58278.1 LytTR family DNA-binding domain-containing protein [Pseudalkalibacillus hwajinpoensis]